MKLLAHPQPFGPGDRLSDFSLPDQNGETFLFSCSANGRSKLVCFAENDGEAEIASLSRLQPDLAEAGVDIIAVTTASAAVNRGWLDNSHADFPVLSDRGERFIRAYRAVTGRKSGPVAFLADPNLRVVEVLDPLDPGAAALELMGRHVISDIPPPVLRVPRVLDSATCRELIRLWEKSHEQIGYSTADGDNADNDRKCSLDHVVRDPLVNQRLTNLVARRIGPEIKRAFGIRDDLSFEVFIVLGYDSADAGFFGPHRDDIGERMQHRRIAVSINLNDDYEGGELHFPEYGAATTRMARGEAAVFGCSLLHQALPVTEGRRFVLTTFLCDPE